LLVAKGKPTQRAFRTLPKLQSIRLVRLAGKFTMIGVYSSHLFKQVVRAELSKLQFSNKSAAR